MSAVLATREFSRASSSKLWRAASHAETPAVRRFLEAAARHASAAELDELLAQLRVEQQLFRDITALERAIAGCAVRELYLIADLVRAALEVAE